MQKKEFGCYSASDFLALAELNRTLEPQIVELRGLVAASPDRIREQLTAPFYWANFYQIPFPDLVVAGLTMLGLSTQFTAFAKESDPHAAILRELNSLEPGSDFDPDNTKYAMGILMAIRGNIRSMSFYSKSLEELTNAVKQGNDNAFFDAVLIDRTILACPPFADRLAWAEYQGDEAFFEKLAKRIRQGVPSKKMRNYVPLRVCLYVLEQENCLESLSENRAYELFCKELKLYPEEVKGDSARSLKRFIQRWQNERAT